MSQMLNPVSGGQRREETKRSGHHGYLGTLCTSHGSRGRHEDDALSQGNSCTSIDTVACRHPLIARFSVAEKKFDVEWTDERFRPVA